MMFVVKGQDILTAKDPWTEREVEEIKNGLADGEKLVASGDLDSDQLYKHLEDVPSWDDETVEPVARELCDRFGMEYGGDMDDLMPKLWAAMVDYVKEEASGDFMCDVMLEGGFIADMSLEYAEEQLRAHRAVDYRVPILPEEYRKAYNDYNQNSGFTVNPWKPREAK